MTATLMTSLAPLAISLLTFFFNRGNDSKERAANYLGYIAYWEKHRKTPVEHYDDLDDLLSDDEDANS